MAMSSILKRLLRREKTSDDKDIIEIHIDDDDDGIYSVPMIMYYLSVIIFIGLPMWYFTCSSTRYPMPNLEELRRRVDHPELPLKLHLDISVVQLSADKLNADRQVEFLRKSLPAQVETSISNVSYEVDWRVRRPTSDERDVFDSYQQQLSRSRDFNSVALANLETDLLKIHKPSNRFKYFFFIIDQAHHYAYCDPKRIHTYTISFERFVYLCPSSTMITQNDHTPIVTLIKQAIDEMFLGTVDEKAVKRTLSVKTDLLISLLPENLASSQSQLTSLTDLIHSIFQKNVKAKFSELNELVNIRLIVQELYDVLDPTLIREKKNKPQAESNMTDSKLPNERVLKSDHVDEIFKTFGSRVNKHSSQNVHNLLMISPDSRKPPIVHEKLDPNDPNMYYIEGQDSYSLIVISDNKSLVLGLRSIIRRLIGLSSANLCKSCLVRRDVFFNRWEMDAIMGASTLAKLRSVLVSLNSISQQVVRIHISKEVAAISREARNAVIDALNEIGFKNTLEAFRMASKAYDFSESAFYNPSLLETLYFPDDLRYLVYFPLMGPLMVPITRSIYGLINSLVLSRRDTKPKIN